MRHFIWLLCLRIIDAVKFVATVYLLCDFARWTVKYLAGWIKRNGL